jgi:hypothetical protein
MWVIPIEPPLPPGYALSRFHYFSAKYHYYWLLADLKDEDEWEPEGSENIPQLSEIRDSIRQLEAENEQRDRFKSSGRIMSAPLFFFLLDRRSNARS